MDAFLLLIITQLVCFVLGHLDRSEFGRYRKDFEDSPRRNRILVLDNIAEKKKIDKLERNIFLVEESFMDVGDIRRVTLELSMSFSMSMSMSGPIIPTGPVVPSVSPIPGTQSPAGSNPSTPTGPNMPSDPSGPLPPSGPPGPTGPSEPSGLSPPTGTSESSNPLPPPGPSEPSIPSPPSGPSGPSGPLPPSGSPNSPTPPFTTPTPQTPSSSSSSPVESSDPPQSGDPNVSPITAAPDTNPTVPPTQGPSSSAERTGDNECPRTNELALGMAADESSTPVALDMSYSAESNSSSIEEFEPELVDELIRTAVFAIFGCIPDTRGKIAANTVEIIDAPCDPTVDLENECFVMQTTFIVGVEGPVNTDVAAYEVYKAIQENMENGNYTKAVSEVVFLEFLSPLPLIPPPGRGGEDNSPDAAEDPEIQRDVDVSPWTIGFSVASVMGGFVSLLVWARSRRSRQNSLARMEETTPWVNPESETVI